MSKEFVLSAPLKYSKGGEKHEEQILTLKAPNLVPSDTCRKAARRLKALGGKAMMDLTRSAKDMFDENTKAEAQAKAKEGEEEDSDISIAFAFAGIDMSDMCGAMRDLSPFVISIGQEPFKHTHWDSLDMDDQEKIVGVYVQTFLLVSGSSKKNP